MRSRKLNDFEKEELFFVRLNQFAFAKNYEISKMYEKKKDAEKFLF